MKKWSVLYLFFTVFFVFGCSSDRQEDGLPCIDVTKDYPEKEIVLTDIADVTFLCLDSDNEDFLYKGIINCITENTIVIADRFSGEILLFSKDGKPKSHFNNIGQGPEDYINAHRVIYDEEADEVFVYAFGKGVLVYTYNGKYKRKIDLPEGFFSNYFYFFDSESFLLNNAVLQFNSNLEREVAEQADPSAQLYNHPFIRISRADGKVLDYPELPTNDIDLKMNADGRLVSIITNPIVSTEKGFLLCNPATDTVFLYDKNKVLTPVICKTPLVKDLNPMVIMNNCLDYGRYQFMDIVTVQFAPDLPTPNPTKYLIRNKKTGEVFRQKIILPDFKGKEVVVSVRNSRSCEKGVLFEFELVELKQAYRENKLSGKLKELVSALNEDEDNNVFMFVDFKE